MIFDSLSAAFGLSSALSWGIGDFSGGIASRRSNVYTTILFSQVLGGVLLCAAALVLDMEFPPLRSMLLGGVAGICGSLGLLAMYTGLAKGRMGIVAPLSAVVTALLPVFVSVFIDGLPQLVRVLGIGIALAAIWMLSAPEKTRSSWSGELPLSLLAGSGFGLFFICIDQAGLPGFLWTLACARAASISLYTLLFHRRLVRPQNGVLPAILLCGVFDTLGNLFFALAAAHGRLDTAAVIASFYPATTVLLAWLLLKERLGARQWIGVAAALMALPMVA